MTAYGASVQVGDQLPSLSMVLHRADLIRYAGASLDFNPIHFDDRVATSVGLPGVIAHGMLTMALAGRVVTEWAGDPGAVLELGVTFTRPVLVPDAEDGVTVELTGLVAAVDPVAGTARVDLTARSGGQTVLSKARAVVRLPSG